MHNALRQSGCDRRARLADARSDPSGLGRGLGARRAANWLKRWLPMTGLTSFCAVGGCSEGRDSSATGHLEKTTSALITGSARPLLIGSPGSTSAPTKLLID